MNIAIDIPEDIARQLTEKWGSCRNVHSKRLQLKGIVPGR